MAVGPLVEYQVATIARGQGAVSWSNDTFVLVLVSSSYSPNAASDAQWSNVSANELPSGGGYTAGGIILSGVSASPSPLPLTLLAGLVSWPSFGAAFKYGVIVRRSGSVLRASDMLVAYFDASVGSSFQGNGYESLYIGFSPQGLSAYQLSTPATAGGGASPDTIAVVTATGTNQAGAAALAATTNIVTTVPAGAGVRLSSSPQRVLNRGAYDLLVYPDGASQIESGSASAPVTVVPNGNALFVRSSGSNTWFVSA